MVRLHHDREWFLQVTEALPRAFCHLDMWPANVRSDGPDRVALDWAFAYDAHLHGLRQSGWDGDEQLVRLAVCASAVKYDRLTGLMPARAGEEQPDYRGERAVSAELR
ncbi:hypothetical protein [Streptomyces sp. HUAS ZL42]|uniref:hypothetical protein n=1 Tax=Streptomyces sp. HUAS ZL42 TaxID=3231715 RepID=UPI00345EC778